MSKGRYQRGNQNPYIEEEQTTQWPKEKVQKDKLRSTKHTYTKYRGTRTPLKTWGLNMSLFNSTDDGPKSLFGIYTVVVGGLVVNKMSKGMQTRQCKHFVYNTNDISKIFIIN
jgi:hypothetical protein